MNSPHDPKGAALPAVSLLRATASAKSSGSCFAGWERASTPASGTAATKKMRHAAHVLPGTPGRTAVAHHPGAGRGGRGVRRESRPSATDCGVCCQPAISALGPGITGRPGPDQPMEAFNVIWFKLPILCSLFLASPWVVYQVWAFISPGLYKRERRFAVPFVVWLGRAFYTGRIVRIFRGISLRLAFLLRSVWERHRAVVSVTEYFDMFVNVVLGVGVVFEFPVLIFFDSVTDGHSGIPGSPQPLRILINLHHRRHSDSHARHFQHDAVRPAHVRPVLFSASSWDTCWC